MDAIVLDASATLAWLYDENNARAMIEPLLRGSSLIAPPVWLLEVTNSVLVQLRRRKVSVEDGNKSLDLLDRLKVQLVPETPERSAREIAAFAQPHQLTAYDAAYLYLAHRSNVPLLTRDANLRIAAARLGIDLL